jgi:hypothetical protein
MRVCALAQSSASAMKGSAHSIVTVACDSRAAL